MELGWEQREVTERETVLSCTPRFLTFIPRLAFRSITLLTPANTEFRVFFEHYDVGKSVNGVYKIEDQLASNRMLRLLVAASWEGSAWRDEWEGTTTLRTINASRLNSVEVQADSWTPSQAYTTFEYAWFNLFADLRGSTIARFLN